MYIAKVCANRSVALFERTPGAEGVFGELTKREVASLDQWIYRVLQLSQLPALERSNHPDSKLYLMDQGLPEACPFLLENFQIPHFFAQDYLHRAKNPKEAKWPSLILGAAGTGTSLHRDGWASNFWMGQLIGRKKWTLYSSASREDILDAQLGRNEYTNSFDVEHRAKAQAGSRLRPVEIVTEPGDIIFIPQGTPHSVENLDTVLAVSVNYIDLSNFWAAQRELGESSLKDIDLQPLAAALKDLDFDWRMDRKPAHADFNREYKQQGKRKKPRHHGAPLPTQREYLPIGPDDARLFRPLHPSSTGDLRHAEL